MLKKSNEEVANLFAPIVANNGVDESMERITQVVAMMKDRVNFVKELWPLCSFFFIAPTEYDEKTVKKRWKADSAKVMGELADVLEGIDDFSVEGQEPVVMNSRNTQNLLADKSLPQISQIYTETFSKKVLCALRILWEFLYTNLKAIKVLG